MPAHSMGYSLVDDGWWPADIRNRIVAAMDEAVATYNAHGYFNTWIYVQYHPGVPTAEANYPDYLKFGGSISPQVAMHEISHTLGTGTTWQWDGQFGGDEVWDGVATKNFVKLYDGPGAEMRKSGVHYYPYGLNYASEDNPQARIRLVKLVSAMRYDMGLDGGADGDGDNLPNEWEMYRFGNLSQTGAGDTDGDGITNRDEYLTESDPLRPCPVKDGHTYVIRAKHSQKVIEAASTAAGAIMRQNPATGSDLQKWTASYRGNGFWKFTNVGSGKVLETAGASWDAGADIMQWHDLGNDNQQWRIVPDGQIYSKMFNRGSRNMVVDVDGGTGATGNGIAISQYYDVLGGSNQDWAFDDVTPGITAGGLRAAYKLDGSARDSAGAQHHGTVSGGVTYTTGRVDAQAASFNGTNANIRVPATVDRNFTLACWVKTTATAGTGQWYNGMGLVDAEVAGVAADFGLSMLGSRAAFGIGAADLTIQSTVAINNGAWHHLAATYDSTGAMKLYVDGVLRGSGTGPSAARTAPAAFNIGSIGGVTGFFNGSVDEVRIYDKLLSTAEIARLANVGQTQVAAYGFDGNLQDSSKHGNQGDGTASLAYAAGKSGSGALVLDGTAGFARIPAAVAGDFSVAYWMKTTTTGGNGQWWAGKAMVDAEVAGVANDWGIALLGSKAGFGIGNTDKTILSSTHVNDGNWHHITATRSSATGAMKLYVDGALEASDAGATAPRNAAHAINLGRSLNGGAFFAGAIDELRIFNYALGPAQVAALGSSLPVAWTATEIGNPGSDGYSGYSTVDGGTFTVTSGGSGVSGSADQLHLLSKPLPGDGGLMLRLNGAPTGNGGTSMSNARAGITIRNSTLAGAAAVEFTYQPGTGFKMASRQAAGGSSLINTVAIQPGTPLWMRLTRNGDIFTAYYATTAGVPQESDWVWLRFADPILTGEALIGLTVIPDQPGNVATAQFSQVADASVSGAQGDAWRWQYFGSTANSGDAADAADPDYDDIPNLFERGFGTDPKVANPASERPAVTKEADFLSLRYRKATFGVAGGLNFQALWSENLGAWSDSDVSDTLESTDGTLIQHRVARVPLSRFPDGKGFMKLRVE